MDTRQVTQLCEDFALGKPLIEPQQVTGGLQHRMWRLKTTQGTFAIKELNPEIISKPGVREAYRLTELISAAFAAHHLPAVTALSTDVGPVRDINGATVIVYPWIDGDTLPQTVAEPERAQQIGQLLGRMHTLDLKFPHMENPDFQPISIEELMALARHAKEMNLTWYEELRTTLPDIILWSVLYRETLDELPHKLVVSHRDLDQTNVLWRDSHTPMLIDWEAAGLVNPTIEQVDAALNWSGLCAGEPQYATFVALIDGYKSTGATMYLSARVALYGCVGNWLNWLEYNLRRVLDDIPSSPDEISLDLRETLNTLTILRCFSSHAATWAIWLDEARKN